MQYTVKATKSEKKEVEKPPEPEPPKDPIKKKRVFSRKKRGA